MAVLAMCAFCPSSPIGLARKCRRNGRIVLAGLGLPQVGEFADRLEQPLAEQRKGKEVRFGASVRRWTGLRPDFPESGFLNLPIFFRLYSRKRSPCQPKSAYRMRKIQFHLALFGSFFLGEGDWCQLPGRTTRQHRASVLLTAEERIGRQRWLWLRLLLGLLRLIALSATNGCFGRNGSGGGRILHARLFVRSHGRIEALQEFIGGD